MLLFLKRIRHSLLSDNRFGKYLLYAIGEIFLVVIGILIALQINNWNDNRIQRQDAKKSYENIRLQILDDQQELTDAKAFNNYLSKAFEYGLKIIAIKDESKMDSLAMVTMGLSQYSDFHRSGNIYETLVNSGALKLLKNDTITTALQHLENTYIKINKLEEMHWQLIIAELSGEVRGVINYTSLEVLKPEQLYSVEMQNIFYEIIGLTKIKDKVYSEVLEEIAALVKLIDLELSIGLRSVAS